MKATIYIIQKEIEELQYSIDNKPPSYHTSNEVKRICEKADISAKALIIEHKTAIELLTTKI